MSLNGDKSKITVKWDDNSDGDQNEVAYGDVDEYWTAGEKIMANWEGIIDLES